MDRPHVPDIPPWPPRCPAGARPRHSERDSARVSTAEAAKAEGCAAHWQEMGAPRQRRELVFVALARGTEARCRAKEENTGAQARGQEARLRQERTAEPALVPSSHPAITSVTKSSRT